MSRLTITVTRQNDQPLTDTLRAEFGPDGGTIGRSGTSTLLLPDPERQISRTHAVIENDGGGFVVHDQGSATPVVVNGKPLGNGKTARIEAGDEIVIGRYAMRVDSEIFDPDATIVRTGAKAPTPPPSPADISMIGTVLSWSEGEAGPAVPAIQTVIVPSPAHASHEDGVETLARPQAAVADEAPQARQIAAGEPAVEAEPATPVTSAAPATIAPAPTTIAAAPAATAPASVTSAPPPVVPLPPAGPVTPEALLQALVTGAGVASLVVPGGLTPELMRAIGQMLRETVRGLLDLLQARALTKREVRADATVIVAHDNNPLKFSPSIEAAMAHLLAPRGTGFMPPLRAIADAHNSLRSHQLAFMAGMQAGLTSLLARLDPKAIESRSGQPSLVGSFVPTTHKARLWDEYVTLHASTVRDADADFQSLFGREFLKAYQREVAQQRADDNGRTQG